MTGSHDDSIFFFFFFLAAPHSMWYLRSLIRDQTSAFRSRNSLSQQTTTEVLGDSVFNFLRNHYSASIPSDCPISHFYQWCTIFDSSHSNSMRWYLKTQVDMGTSIQCSLISSLIWCSLTYTHKQKKFCPNEIVHGAASFLYFCCKVTIFKNVLVLIKLCVIFVYQYTFK